PNEEFGEEVKAVVQPRDMRDATPEFAAELIAWCRERLAHIKCPKSIDFEEELPRAPTGKLYSAELLVRYWKDRTTGICAAPGCERMSALGRLAVPPHCLRRPASSCTRLRGRSESRGLRSRRPRAGGRWRRHRSPGRRDSRRCARPAPAPARGCPSAIPTT